MDKFYFVCRKCNEVINNFELWYKAGQVCPKCGHNRVDTKYSQDIGKIKDLIKVRKGPKSLWHYFDYLPLNDKNNIVSKDEGIVPIERISFLEKFAKDKYNLNLKVFVTRNDCNPATGTFKDEGATLAASVLKENGIKQYVVSSTGNTATAYAHYLALAGISLSVFLPQNVHKQNETEICSHGQRVFKVQGDFATAKKLASEFAKKYDILITSGNFDPLRVEAKKTMVFEWLRIMGEIPSVYIQALSGGTGPFAIEKAHLDLEGTGLFDNLPRLILSQPSGCAPMAHAWANAKSEGFQKGFESIYPVYENPETMIPTLATGDPKTYPAISKLVKKSNGEIIEFDEKLALDITRLFAFETGIRIGPASSIAVGGFFESLANKLLKDGDIVLVNLGEGVNRAADFLGKLNYTSVKVNSINDCKPFDREAFRKIVWKKFLNYKSDDKTQNPELNFAESEE